MKKKCTLCKKEKEIEEFKVDTRLISGRTSRCEECISEVGKKLKKERAKDRWSNIF